MGANSPKKYRKSISKAGKDAPQWDLTFVTQWFSSTMRIFWVIYEIPAKIEKNAKMAEVANFGLKFLCPQSFAGHPVWGVKKCPKTPHFAAVLPHQTFSCERKWIFSHMKMLKYFIFWIGKPSKQKNYTLFFNMLMIFCRVFYS